MSSAKIQSLVARRPERRIYDLGQMNLRQLVVAYATYPSIVLYAVLCLVSIAGAVWFGALAQPVRTVVAIIAAVVIYPVAEYVLHRFVLHARWLYKNPLTADLWKRIHYDHHQDPQRPGRAVRLAVQHPAADLRPGPAHRLGHRRPQLGAERPGHRLCALHDLRVLPLRAASELHAQERVAAADQEAPHGPPFSQ